VFVGIIGPMVVRPIPVCLMMPGCICCAPCVVIPAMSFFSGIFCKIVSMFPSPFCSVSICVDFFRIGRVC
jgi:hypothetical protein